MIAEETLLAVCSFVKVESQRRAAWAAGRASLKHGVIPLLVVIAGALLIFYWSFMLSISNRGSSSTDYG